MHRTREILQEKFDGQNVEQHVKGWSQPIVRSARQTGRISNGNFRDARAIKTSQCRNESMQLAVEIDFLEHLGAVRLKSSAKVPQFDSGRFRHKPIRDARWNFACQ